MTQMTRARMAARLVSAGRRAPPRPLAPPPPEEPLAEPDDPPPRAPPEEADPRLAAPLVPRELLTPLLLPVPLPAAPRFDEGAASMGTTVESAALPPRPEAPEADDRAFGGRGRFG